MRERLNDGGLKKEKGKQTLQLVIDCSDTTITFFEHITGTKERQNQSNDNNKREKEVLAGVRTVGRRRRGAGVWGKATETFHGVSGVEKECKNEA